MAEVLIIVRVAKSKEIKAGAVNEIEIFTEEINFNLGVEFGILK